MKKMKKESNTAEFYVNIAIESAKDLINPKLIPVVRPILKKVFEDFFEQDQKRYLESYAKMITRLEEDRNLSAEEEKGKLKLMHFSDFRKNIAKLMTVENIMRAALKTPFTEEMYESLDDLTPEDVKLGLTEQQVIAFLVRVVRNNSTKLQNGGSRSAEFTNQELANENSPLSQIFTIMAGSLAKIYTQGVVEKKEFEEKSIIAQIKSLGSREFIEEDVVGAFEEKKEDIVRLYIGDDDYNTYKKIDATAKALDLLSDDMNMDEFDAWYKKALVEIMRELRKEAPGLFKKKAEKEKEKPRQEKKTPEKKVNNNQAANIYKQRRATLKKKGVRPTSVSSAFENAGKK